MTVQISPGRPFARVTQLAECHLAMVDVDGSSPFSRSTLKDPIALGICERCKSIGAAGKLRRARCVHRLTARFSDSHSEGLGSTPSGRATIRRSFKGRTAVSKTADASSSLALRAISIIRHWYIGCATGYEPVAERFDSSMPYHATVVQPGRTGGCDPLRQGFKSLPPPHLLILCIMVVPQTLDLMV